MDHSFAKFQVLEDQKDSKNLRTIQIVFDGPCDSQGKLDAFFKDWLDCYELPFSFRFDFLTENLQTSMADIGRAKQVADFMSHLRLLYADDPAKYGKLMESQITIQSFINRHLLKLIFSLKPPLADVVVVDGDGCITDQFPGAEINQCGFEAL